MTLNKLLFIVILIALIVAVRSCQWEQNRNERLQNKPVVKYVW